MSSLSSSMEHERMAVIRRRPYDYQRVLANRTERREHDECGETALYALSPICLALYYAFDQETIAE
ncbi:hypothetical protein ACFPES_35490 [Paenibacillus sp. GCM10023248]|uniref:hypothetical protein n=1 Tax=Bacillales TaxID=1385 RepID=UPI002379B06F|nr:MULTISPECIES: hypothetical protein [Bacillales]MDD9272295.1 hypothetical protein [Paenibacillus sp. MAHUQ-63]MDR6883220.1 hypothetical protein [Bacillus sp. 3255]